MLARVQHRHPPTPTRDLFSYETFISTDTFGSSVDILASYHSYQRKLEMNKSKNHTSNWLYFQLVALIAGTTIGWWSVAAEVKSFCAAEGGGLTKLTSFSGTVETNPLLTPCFYGSIVFLVSLIWTLAIINNKTKDWRLRQQSRLVKLLWFGAIFALVNNIVTFWKFYGDTDSGPPLGCDPDKITNPYWTACFMGLVAFTAASIAGSMYLRSISAKSADTEGPNSNER